MRLIFISFTLLLTLNSVNAQDLVIKRDGTQIEGVVKILFSDRNDQIIIRDTQISADKIDRIIFGNESEIVSKELTYYNTDLKIEITKFALLENILTGSAELFSYQGEDFRFALTVRGETSVLQEIPINTETNKVQTYRIVLLVNLEECASRADIFKTTYSRNSIINIVNTYNRCNNDEYLAIEEAVERFRVFYTGVSIGLNHAANDLLVPLVDRVQGQPSFIGRVDQKGVISNNLAVGFFVQRNIIDSKIFFLKLGLNFRRYNFSITSFDSDVEVENLTTNELDFNLGLNYRPLHSKTVSPELGAGILFSSFVHNKNIYHEVSREYPVIPSNYIGNTGLDYFIEMSVFYRLNQSFQLFATAEYLFRTGDGMISRNGGFYFDENLSNNYTLSLGISLESIRSGKY